jgi:hypothetical protein
MGKILLNMTPSEPLSLMKKLPFFDDSMELDALLAVVLYLGFHDLIRYHMFYVFRIELCRG